MKTIKELREEDEYLVEGINLRTVSGVLLVGKSRALEKSIKSINIVDGNDGLNPKELNKKLNLLSTQLLFNSLLVAQLSLMSKKR